LDREIFYGVRVLLGLRAAQAYRGSVRLLKSALFNVLPVLGFVCAVADTHAQSINQLLAPGKLSEVHAKYESECRSCHKPFDEAAQSGLCKDCHKELAADVNTGRGLHGHIEKDKPCKDCHAEHKGRDARIARLDTRSFDHSITGFILRGGHLKDKVLCKDCHSPQKKYRDAPTDCFGCHQQGDKHKGGLGKDCQNCHVEADWKTTHFDHSKTDYPLLGKHIGVECKDCHINEQFKGTLKACNECHNKDDKHKGSFGPKCEACHSERGWKEILFDHEKQTKYPLSGKHREVKCAACHKGDLYTEKLRTDCLSCHRKDDKHKGSFGPKCESCHTERGWKERLFDHDRKTRFPLTGKHREVTCVSCHKGDPYKERLKTDCYSCHQKDDKHKGGFGPKCESCHTDRSWKELLFDHDKRTKFPLLGRHREAKCSACHTGDLYKKLAMDCYSCHQKDDKHQGQEGKKCENCHHAQSWKKTDFDHRVSRFPLTGRHAIVECRKCHATPSFKDANSDCLSCHQKSDAHSRRLGTDCARCHNTRAWRDWDFDHDKTRFKLQGKHKEIRCLQCHRQPVSGARITLSIGCSNCHSKDDKHDGAYGALCGQCHYGTSWKDIRAGTRRWEYH
jgi:hypothetical protein